MVLGDGTHSLVNKLQDRNNYLNRPHKRKVNQVDCNNPITNKKGRVNARAGCINWSPTTHETHDIEVNMNDIATDENFYQILNTTYNEQRGFINKSPIINEIKEIWPILFSKNAIYWHFNKLTNSNIYKEK